MSYRNIVTGRSRAPLIACALLFLLAGCNSGSRSGSVNPPPPPPPDPPSAQLPNILFIVMDDLGVDQLTLYGFGGLTPPATPSIDAIAQSGVRFRNAWSMPTCSPTRATFFEGRYPFRTQVRNAVLAMDLANSQVSPYEATTPKILKKKGYINALIGKMHLSGSDLNPDNNPLGHEVMRELGWDYFEGYLDGGPYPIDTTAGGVAPAGTYSCGFVPNSSDDPVNGADYGACYLATGSCTEMGVPELETPGRSCMERGGIFVPGAACAATPPAHIDFTTQNGYYTGEWVINRENGETELVPASDPGARGYRTILETDRAIEWIKRQNGDRPWMLSLGYSAIHTPVQQPPVELLPEDAEPTGGFDCKDPAQQRVLTNQMLEAMDHEISRLLIETGLATRNYDGSLEYHPEETNTVVIIVGDNGTYAPSVKAPFNPTRAKGFPYQSGVWVPLIVSGPMVAEPGREVPHMVNTADLFSLFGEIAGADVREEIPEGRLLDARPMLPYLTDPAQESIREHNYTEVGMNITANGTEPPAPCVIPAANVCVQLFPQQEVCEDQGGTWFGKGGAAGPAGLPSCCAVNEFLTEAGEDPVEIMPITQRAIRNEQYKLVEIERLSCQTNAPQIEEELYHIDEAAPLPKLDNAPSNLLRAGHGPLTSEQQQNYDSLRQAMQQLHASEVPCPGDGNADGVVDAEDLANWEHFSTHNGGNSSWYDFNHDGKTDAADRAIIEENLGRQCMP